MARKRSFKSSIFPIDPACRFPVPLTSQLFPIPCEACEAKDVFSADLRRGRGSQRGGNLSRNDASAPNGLLSCCAVSSLMTWTLAFGTTLPLESVSVPEICPVNPCANTERERTVAEVTARDHFNKVRNMNSSYYGVIRAENQPGFERRLRLKTVTESLASVRFSGVTASANIRNQQSNSLSSCSFQEGLVRPT